MVAHIGEAWRVADGVVEVQGTATSDEETVAYVVLFYEMLEDEIANLNHISGIE
jgi:hypothetical protein